jgi:hypothetical protein
MNSWQEYQRAEPLLRQIEETYAQLERFEQSHPPEGSDHHGVTAQHLRALRQSVLKSIAADVRLLPGRVYYWLYPFYRGDFARLSRVLSLLGGIENRHDHPGARQTFYRFFRSLPREARKSLDAHLNDPELSRRSEAIQSRIDAMRSNVKARLDQEASN